MRIAVMMDVHANLPALEAALGSIRAEGCDAIFHTGDVIAIGPFPAECLEVLLNTPDTQFVMGNHDAYFVHGLPTPQPAWMSDGELEHQRWTHSRLDPNLCSVFADWPPLLEHDLEGVRILFVHYALGSVGQDFRPVTKDPTAADLDSLFEFHGAALIFYGHHHARSDQRGRARYVNPGSSGCHCEPIARYCMVELQGGSTASSIVSCRMMIAGWSRHSSSAMYRSGSLSAAHSSAVVFRPKWVGLCGDVGEHHPHARHPKESTMPDFNPEHKAVLDDLLLGHPAVRPGKMFGYPAYYVGKKLSICLYEEGVGVKLPEQSAAQLLASDPNATPFRPMGRPKMREWVQINLSRSEDYRQYESVFEESIRYLLAQQ